MLPNNSTKAEQKFIAYLKKRDPSLKDKDIPELLSGFKRFVKVVHKIYTEPQAQFSIQEIQVDGKTKKTMIISTDYHELLKVRDKSKKKESLVEIIKRFNKSVTKDKYGR